MSYTILWWRILDCLLLLIHSLRTSRIYNFIIKTFAGGESMISSYHYNIRLWQTSHPSTLKKSLKIPKGYSNSVTQRSTDTTMVNRKWTRGQTTTYQILHRKLKIEQHEPTSCSSYNPCDKSWKREGPGSACDQWNISVVNCDIYL